jgi:hypothetical protein
MSHPSLDATLAAAPRIHPARRVVTLKPYKASNGTSLAHDPDTGEGKVAVEGSVRMGRGTCELKIGITLMYMPEGVLHGSA